MVAVGTVNLAQSAVHTDSGGTVFRFIGLSRIVIVVALAACASSGASTGGAARRSADQITYAEISSASAINAYELINRLRPTWLRTQGRSGIIVVYLDGHRLGDISSLRSLSTEGIRSLQWLDAGRAATVLTEIGSDAIAGAIVIKTH